MHPAHFPAGVTLKPGTMIRQAGYITDLLPTCLEAAGTSYPIERAGRKILPLER